MVAVMPRSTPITCSSCPGTTRLRVTLRITARSVSRLIKPPSGAVSSRDRRAAVLPLRVLRGVEGLTQALDVVGGRRGLGRPGLGELEAELGLAPLREEPVERHRRHVHDAK